MKFFVVVALLFLMQTLVGSAAAHYRADPGSFYGFDLSRIFPSNLLRTWHLQTAIFWIATAYVAAALFLGRSLRTDEPRWLAGWTHVLFGAFALVIGGSLLGEWLGISQLLGRLVVLVRQPGLGIPGAGARSGNTCWWSACSSGSRCCGSWCARGTLAQRGLGADRPHVPAGGAGHSRCSTCRRCSFGAKTNFTVVDTWRFWIIHLWVEGFFEFFVTTVVALTFYQLGLTRRNVALRVIYLDAILYFAGGLIGTGHHWYLTGQSNVNMALSAMFSVLEVVPLTLLTLDAWDFVRTTRGDCDVCGKPRRVAAQVDVLLPDGGGLLELRRRRHVRLPDQPADRQLLRGRHEADAEPRPRRLDGRVRHAGDRADGVRPAPDQRATAAGPASRSTSRSPSGASTSAWR